MAIFTLAQVRALADIFGYDVVVNGDAGFAGVFMGDVFLYQVAIR